MKVSEDSNPILYGIILNYHSPRGVIVALVADLFKLACSRSWMWASWTVIFPIFIILALIMQYIKRILSHFVLENNSKMAFG